MPGLPTLLLRLLRRRERWVTRRLAWRYAEGKEPAWGAGYLAYRAGQIGHMLEDPSLPRAIARGEMLPEGHGRLLDERAVELPWAAGHLLSLEDGARVLDAGSALNHTWILDHRPFASSNLHIATLRPEGNCFWNRGISYLFVDLRALPIADGYYDAVISVSTLEHVGFDNTAFGAMPGATDADAHLVALRELLRVLRPGGTLLFTVPFGRYERHHSFQQFDEGALLRAVQSLGPTQEWDFQYFRHSPIGWTRAISEECVSAAYVPWIMLRPTERGSFAPQEDGAVAARAVACVRFVKP